MDYSTAHSHRTRMFPVAAVLLMLTFCIAVDKSLKPFKILLLTPPLGGKGGHLPWMKALAETLSSRGHEVILLLQGSGRETSKMYRTKHIPSRFSNEQSKQFLKLYLSDSVRFIKNMVTECEAILDNKELLSELLDKNFDLAVTDRFYHCGYLIAEILKVPFAVFDGASYNGPLDAHAPTPLAYVPMFNSRLTDNMALIERLRNVYLYFARQIASKTLLAPFSRLISKYNLSSTEMSIEGVMGKAQLWLLDSDFSLEFPRPLMPNMVYIGGLLITPPKPLPKDLEDFVNSSGDHGVVVFSFGTWIDEIVSTEMWNKIAAGLALIPQKVILKYIRPSPPSHVGKNTKLLPWLPQNDLLGHPKTKVFVTHGGTNSVLEAIAHAQPMVVIPLCCDHIDHSVRIVAKGAGVSVDMQSLEPKDLAEAIEEVINNRSYSQAIERLHRIQKDQPLPPRERIIFWIEHVIRNNGSYLRAKSFELSFVQYFLLDVISVAAVMVLLTILAMGLVLRVTCLYLKSTRKHKIN